MLDCPPFLSGPQVVALAALPLKPALVVPASSITSMAAAQCQCPRHDPGNNSSTLRTIMLSCWSRAWYLLASTSPSTTSASASHDYR